MAMLSVFPLKGAVQLLSVLCVASAVLLMINSRDQLSRSPRIEALGLPIPLSEDISIDPPAVTILRDTRLPRQTTRSAAMDFASPVSAAPVTVLQKHRLHKAMMRSDELDASTVYPHHLAGGFQTLGMADIKPTETILDEAESGPSTVTNEVTNEVMLPLPPHLFLAKPLFFMFAPEFARSLSGVPSSSSFPFHYLSLPRSLRDPCAARTHVRPPRASVTLTIFALFRTHQLPLTCWPSPALAPVLRSR